MRTRKILSLIAVFSIIFLDLSPAIQASAAENELPEENPAGPEVSLNNLPPFPEDLNRQPTNWAEVDWDKEIVLPRDEEEYHAKVGELSSQGKYDEVKNLKMKKMKLNSDEAMEYYSVPNQIQELVKEYRTDTKRAAKKEKQSSANLLKENIYSLGLFERKAEGRQSDSDKNIINFSQAEKLPIGKTLRGGQAEETVMRVAPVKNSKKQVQRHSLYNSTLESLSKKQFNFPQRNVEGRVSLWQKVLHGVGDFFHIDTVHAEGETPFIEYYDGIEDNTMDYLLYYLSQKQNADGSFGDYNQYELTGEFALLLAQYNRTDSEQFALAINYLKNTEPQNNREKAFKIRLIASLGEPYQTLLDELLAEQNQDNGGFGLTREHQPDVITTAEVVLALMVTNYSVDDQLPPALLYILNQIHADGSMYYTAGSQPSYYLANYTAEHILPFKNLSVPNGESYIAVQDKIDALLNFLSTHYDEETASLLGTRDEVDEIMTLRSFQIYDVESVKQDLLWDNNIVKQNMDGSFGDSFYATLAAMKAFPQPDLAIIDIESTGVTTNQSPANFVVSIVNNGYKAPKNIHLYEFIDQVKQEDGYDLTSSGISLGPKEGIWLNVEFDSEQTMRFVGDTLFSYYVENTDDRDSIDNWQEKTITFASAADGSPGLPMYFMAHKHDVDGEPALAVGWLYKPDPDRMNYVVCATPQGSSLQCLGVANNQSGAIVVGFNNDVTYDVTVGVLHQDAQTITLFNDSIPITMNGDPAVYNGSLSGYVTNNFDLEPDAYVNGHGFYGPVDDEANFSFTDQGHGNSAAWADRDYLQPFRTIFPVNIGEETENIRVFTRLLPDSIAPEIDYVTIQNVPTPDVSFKNQQVVTMLAQGTDNIAAKEADFYYWDPNEGIWIYLATQTEGGGTPTPSFFYDWYVPASLVGPGYKMKAVLRDYQGNESEAVEWQYEFEIIEGTIPAGTVEVLGLQNNTWGLTETKTIQWNITTPNEIGEIDYINLYYQEHAAYSLYFPGEPTDTSMEWTMPFSQGLVTDNAYIKMGICDIYDNCVDLVSDSFIIADNTPDAPTGTIHISNLEDGVWRLGETKTISWDIQSENPLSPLDVRFHYGGGTYVIDSEYDPAASSIDFSMPVSMSYVTDSAYVSVTACETVNHKCSDLVSENFVISDDQIPPQYPWGSPELYGPFGQNNYDLYRKLKAVYNNSDGSIEVIYTEDEDIGNDEYKRIKYRKFFGGAWEPAVTIAEEVRLYGGEYVYLPQVETYQRGVGDIDVVYNKEVGNGLEGLDSSDVYYAHVLNGSLVDTKQLSNDDTCSDDAKVVVDSTGKISIVWEQGYRYSDQNGFGALHFLEGYGQGNWQSEQVLTDEWTTVSDLILENEKPVVLVSYKNQLYLMRKNTSNWQKVSISRPDIAKAKLDVYTADVDKFYLIVQNPDTSGDTYYWLPQIKTKDELDTILTQGGFVNKAAILNTWAYNEYYYNSYDRSLFTTGNQDEYDVFYKFGNEDSNYRYNVYNVRSQVDFSTGNSSVSNYGPAVDKGADDDVRTYDIAQDQNHNYHIFYIKSEELGVGTGSTIQRAYHALYDGVSNYFNTWISDFLMYVYDSYIIGTENNEFLNVYYESDKNGSTQTFINSANYSNVINDRLDWVSPEYNGTADTNPVVLSWTHSGGTADSYEVFLGTNRFNLHSICQTPDNSCNAGELGLDTKYYWQVVGHRGSDLIYSNIWNFTTLASYGSSLTGSVRDENDTPIAGALVTLSNHSLGAISDVNGNYEISNVPAGDYDVTVAIPGYDFTEHTKSVTVGEQDVSLDFSGGVEVPYTIYEDAENGNTDGWSVTGSDPGSTSINNEYEDSLRGRTIDVFIDGFMEEYELKNDDDSVWNNTSQTVARWDMKVDSEHYFVYFKVQTNQGPHQVAYTSYYTETPDLTGNYIAVGVPQYADGQWHTVIRDLQKDAEEIRGGLEITSIDSVVVVGDMEIDNVVLSEAPADTSSNIITGTVTDYRDMPIENALVLLSNQSLMVKTDVNGNYTLSDVPNGSHEITVTKEGYAFYEHTKNVELNDANQTIDFVNGEPVDYAIYEDAEDATTTRWSVLDATPEGAYAENLEENETLGRVIKLNSDGINNAFSLNKDDGSILADRNHKMLSFNVKGSGPYYVFIRTWANIGGYYITYNPYYTEGMQNANGYIHLNGRPYQDNEWHTIVVNLEDVIKSVNPDLYLQQVDSVYVRGSAMIDNVVLYDAAPTPLAGQTISGTVTDDQNQPIEGALLSLSSHSLMAKTDAQGNYSIENVPDGDYEITITANGYSFPDHSAGVTMAGSNLTQDFEGASAVDYVLYEDGEDEQTLGWAILDATPEGYLIENFYENSIMGRVIKLTSDGINNSFSFGKEDGTVLADRDHKMLSFNVKGNGTFHVYIRTWANIGGYLVTYNANYVDGMANLNGNINLDGRPYQDDEWHTVIVDLDEVIKTENPDLYLQQVDNIYVRGSAMIDNVVMW